MLKIGIYALAALAVGIGGTLWVARSQQSTTWSGPQYEYLVLRSKGSLTDIVPNTEKRVQAHLSSSWEDTWLETKLGYLGREGWRLSAVVPADDREADSEFRLVFVRESRE